MTTLSPADRTKLARVLGMLGSSHQGERDTAGLAADRIVRGAGLDWNDLLQPAPPPAHEVARQWRPDARQTWPFRESAARSDARFCARYFNQLTAWEQSFVSSVASRSTISDRQGAILRQTANRLRDRGFA